MQGSIGMALDLGFTYDVSDEITVTGSVLDLGSLKFNHQLTQIDFEDSKIRTDEWYDPPEGGELDYWQEKFIEGLLPIETSPTSYSQFRSPKLNASGQIQHEKIGKTGSVGLS